MESGGAVDPSQEDAYYWRPNPNPRRRGSLLGRLVGRRRLGVVWTNKRC